MALTRRQIIDEGLSQAGRTDLVSNARLWLNIFLEKMYRTQDFHWMVKSSDGLAISQGMSVPSDYLRAKTATVTVAGAKTDILEVSKEEYDSMNRSSTAVTGVPTHFYPNHDEGKFYFYPSPSSSVTALNLGYYYLPTISTHTDSSGDAVSPKWGEDVDVLIQYIKAMAMEYNDDPRAKDAEAKTMALLSQSKVNSYDKRAGFNRLKMGKSFRKRF
jgi:hypothetical protein